jgi:hypothetical protein
MATVQWELSALINSSRVRRTMYVFTFRLPTDRVSSQEGRAIGFL